MQVRLTFWAFLAVFLFSLAGYAVTAGAPGARIYMRLMFLSGFLILVSFVWTYISLRGVTLKRTARFLRQQVGQVFEERFEVFNDYPVGKLLMDIRDQSQLPGQTGSKILTWIGRRQRRSYVTYTRLTHRGQFVLGPTTVSSGDPFGMFSSSKTFESDRLLLVLPYMIDIRRLPFPPGVLPGGRALRRRTPEVTPYASSVREYAPGDSLNRIHWPTTARKDRMMVKEFDQDPQADIWIFVDAYHGVQLNAAAEERDQAVERQWIWRQQYKFHLPYDTFEYAVSIAASMAKYYVQSGRAVGLASAGQAFTILSPERGERQMGKILEVLAHLRAEGELPMNGLVEAQAPHLTRGSTVVLITPGLDKIVEASVEDLMHRDLEPVAVLLDRHSFGAFGNAQELQLRLRARHIPTTIVAKGADLRLALEEGF